MVEYIEVDHIQVLDLLSKGGLLIDVRGPGGYAQEHIKGALNIPTGEIEAKAAQIPKDRPVIVYCSSVQCTASLRAAESLSKLGFGNIHRFVGGLLEWKGAQLPAEST